MTGRQMSRSRASRAGLSRLARVARRAAVPAVGALALWGVAPAVASASSGGWQLNGVGLSEVIATSSKGNVKVTDTKFPLIGTMAVECEDTVEGTAGAGGVGSVTKWTTSKCAALGGCEKSSTAVMTPLNLPWHTELAVVEGSIRELLVSGGKGTPGYKIECKSAGVKIEDSCSATLSTTTTNTTGGVTATFNSGEKLACTDGGAGSGSLEGSQSITATGGGKLSTATEKSAIWQANHNEIFTSKAINWKGGRLTLSDNIAGYGEIAVECEDAGSGTAGSAGTGEVTEWTPSKCVAARGKHCESEEAIEALNLPWHTELVFSEGKTIEAIASGGKGTPGLKLKCKASGEKFADECPVARPTMKNGESGVGATFDSSISCTEGRTGEALVEGSQTLKLTNGELLGIA